MDILWYDRLQGTLMRDPGILNLLMILAISKVEGMTFLRVTSTGCSFTLQPSNNTSLRIDTSSDGKIEKIG